MKSQNFIMCENWSVSKLGGEAASFPSPIGGKLLRQTKWDEHKRELDVWLKAIQGREGMAWHKRHYFNPAGRINKNVNDIVNPIFSLAFLTPFLMSTRMFFSADDCENGKHRRRIFHTQRRFLLRLRELNIICEWLPSNDRRRIDGNALVFFWSFAI